MEQAQENQAKLSWAFTLNIDPSTIGTAQQKKFDPRTRRFFTDRKVEKGMKVISLLAQAQRKVVGAKLPVHGSPINLKLRFFYSVPKSRRKTIKGVPPPMEGAPCFAFWAGDCDNRAKAVIDALTKADFWPDDRYVCSLYITKRWTYKNPRIEVEISEDE